MKAFNRLFARWDWKQNPTVVHPDYQLHGVELAANVGPFKVGEKLPLAIIDMNDLHLVLVDTNGKQHTFALELGVGS